MVLKHQTCLLLAAAMLCFSTIWAKAIDIVKPKGVLELFTSQGCSSCPPADRVLAKLIEEGKILGLSRHVDYWDYLGWKDPFALPENTQRQYGYARTLHERQVYTPQAIVNGRKHLVGSREAEIRTLVEEMDKKGDGMTVPIDVAVKTDSLTIRVTESARARDATLYLVHFEAQKQIEIERGENAGKTLTYYNVVRGSQPLGMIKAKGLAVEFPLAELRRQGLGSCALLVQKSDAAGNPGSVLGAVVIHGL